MKTRSRMCHSPRALCKKLYRLLSQNKHPSIAVLQQILLTQRDKAGKNQASFNVVRSVKTNRTDTRPFPRHKRPTPKTGARSPGDNACESPPLLPPPPPPCFCSRRSQGREPPGPAMLTPKRPAGTPGPGLGPSPSVPSPPLPTHPSL